MITFPRILFNKNAVEATVGHRIDNEEETQQQNALRLYKQSYSTFARADQNKLGAPGQVARNFEIHISAGVNRLSVSTKWAKLR